MFFVSRFTKKFKRRLGPHIINVTGGLTPSPTASPELLGELFQDVQLRRVHPDGKTFVDLVPKGRLKKIERMYKKKRHHPDFDLHKFVQDNFQEYIFRAEEAYKSDPNYKIEEHIDRLWTVLTRRTFRNRGSLMALPHPYIVPGGRFSEQFYWDTYFIMLGLSAVGRYEEIDSMMKNYAYMIRKLGFIPNASRTYLVSRSQPPFFALMVRMMAEGRGRSQMVRYLPYLLAEYRFWMKGSKKLTAKEPTHRRVVRMPDGEVLNRYFDSNSTPRPESYKEDVETAYQSQNRLASQIYRDLRAGGESGWDFSSRWLADGKNLHSIHTTDIVPVDLNCLLATLEYTIADAYAVIRQKTFAKRFYKKAERRIEAIHKYCWSDERQYFFDYDIAAKSQTDAWTLAGVFPLYLGIASNDEAKGVAETIEEHFLKPGGLTTTTVQTGEQWDAPNGWAPLQWAAVRGLRNYGYHELANDISDRWLKNVHDHYKKTGKLVEKYDVMQPGVVAGGGEYEVQDGFGWTNGVLLALLADEREEKEKQ